MTPHLYQNCLAITAPLDMRSVCRTGGYVQTSKPSKWVLEWCGIEALPRPGTNRGLPSRLVVSFLRGFWRGRSTRSRGPQQYLVTPAERVQLCRKDRFPVPRQNSIPAGDRVGSPYEHRSSKPGLSGKSGGHVLWSLVPASCEPVRHIIFRKGRACGLRVRGISSVSAVVSMMQSTESIVRNHAPGVCGTNPPRRSSLP